MRLLASMLSLCLATVSLEAQSAHLAAVMGQSTENEELLAIENRVLTVSYPLFIAAARITGDQERNFGFSLHDKDFYERSDAGAYGDWISKRYDLGRGIYVRFVHPDSPAARVGLEVGDRIVSINGEHRLGNAWKTMAQLRDWGKSEKNIAVAVERERRVRTFTVKGLEARALPTAISSMHALDLRLEDGQIVLTRQLIDELKSDQHLALALAHLIAKDYLKGNCSENRECERAVDELALYITAQAGFKESLAPELWKQLAGTERAPRLNPLSRQHPVDAYRLQQMELIAQEIAEKRQKKLPILPN